MLGLNETGRRDLVLRVHTLHLILDPEWGILESVSIAREVLWPNNSPIWALNMSRIYPQAHFLVPASTARTKLLPNALEG